MTAPELGRYNALASSAVATMFNDTTTGMSSEAQNDPGRGGRFECFLCGECCARYQVRLNTLDARRIADGLGLSLDEWADRYVDKRWQLPDTFVLRRVDGVCVFLQDTGNAKTRLCAIHCMKPRDCREWAAGPHRKACQDGLAKYWGLAVGVAGDVQGMEQDLKEFYTFIESLGFPGQVD